MEQARSWGEILAASFLSATCCFSQGTPMVMTLDEYAKQAVEQGVQGKVTQWTLEQAGYSREVVMRQTSLPTLSAGYSHNRGETKDDVFGLDTLTDTNESSLTLNEQTPLGTTLNVAGQYDSSTNPGAVPGLGRPALTASVQQPIYIFVKNAVARKRRSAELAFATAKSTFLNAELSLRAQARMNYYSVILGEESVKLEERQVASVQKIQDVTQALVDAGRSAPVELMRAKINSLVERTNLDNAAAQRDQATLTAKNFILLPLGQEVRFVTEMEFAPFNVSLERLINYALLHQPQLDIFRNSRDQSQLDYEASVEPTRPTFTIGGTYDDQQYQNLILTHGWTWTGAANWLFFDSFVTNAQARSARIGVWVAELNLKNGEEAAEVNVRNTYITVKNTEHQIQYLKVSLDQARRNVDVERLRFQNGVVQLTDVFDAQTALRNLENQYLSLLVQFNEGKDTLSTLIGADVETLL